MECIHKTCSCPLFSWLELFEKKWNLRIVRALYKANLGFNELKNSIPGITQGVLSSRLDELQKNEMVIRKVVKQKPLVVQYSLSPKVRQVLSCWAPFKQEKTVGEIKIGEKELKVKC